MSSSNTPRLVAVVLAVCGWSVPLAHADKAAADAAFTEAKRLVAAGKIADACPKFELSYAQDPQVGTLLNLADCHEQLGKLATAWAEFREARELARNRNDERARYAEQRIAQLAPRISHLVIRAADEAPDRQVFLDDRDVTALLGVPIPVDPGPHEVRAVTPGAAAARTSIEIVEEGSTIEREAPLPDTAAVTAETEAPPPAGDRPGRGRRIAALATTGAGLVTAGVGLYFGSQAYARWDDSRASCDAEQICDARGAALVDDAKSAAFKANVLVGVGAGAVVAGAILWLTAPREAPRRAVTAQPIVAPGALGGSVLVRF